MTRTDAQDAELLESAFAAARSRPPEPSQALRDRVLMAAVAEQPAGAFQPGSAVQSGGAARSGASVWGEVVRAIGGWRGVGGLSTAMLLGLVIGLAGVVETPISGGSVEVVDLMPGAEALFADTTAEN